MSIRAPIRVRCPLGGPAPCIDDLCHGVDTTMCGLEMDFDVCYHGFYPDTCNECSGDREWDDWDDHEAPDLANPGSRPTSEGQKP